MTSIEGIVDQLEVSMKHADSRLESLTKQLDIFESRRILPNDILYKDAEESQTSNVVEPSADPDSTVPAEEGNSSEKTASSPDDGLDPKLVRELLSEVTRVRSEYNQLHNEIKQVQEIQQEVTRSVRKQMKQVQSHFDDLRNRIIGSGVDGKLPSK